MMSKFDPIMVAVAFGLMVILVFAVTFGIAVQTSHAQTGNDKITANQQVTLSDDLANNPLAQDILKKIEQTKKWIVELEERNYQQLGKRKRTGREEAAVFGKTEPRPQGMGRFFGITILQETRTNGSLRRFLILRSKRYSGTSLNSRSKRSRQDVMR